MSKRHIQLPNDMAEKGLLPKDLLVYTSIKSYMNNETKSCFPSLEAIVKKSGVSKPTVLKAIEKLKEAGYIEVSRKGRSNLYTFLPYKQFEPFSYEFLERDDITAEEKSFIIASQQYMFTELVGYGKMTYSERELSEKINLSYPSVIKYQKALEDKGFLTTVKTNAKDSDTGIMINEKFFHLDELGQAIIWVLQKHDIKISSLEAEQEKQSKDIKILLREINRLKEDKTTTDEIEL